VPFIHEEFVLGDIYGILPSAETDPRAQPLLPLLPSSLDQEEVRQKYMSTYAHATATRVPSLSIPTSELSILSSTHHSRSAHATHQIEVVTPIVSPTSSSPLCQEQGYGHEPGSVSHESQSRYHYISEIVLYFLLCGCTFLRTKPSDGRCYQALYILQEVAEAGSKHWRNSLADEMMTSRRRQEQGTIHDITRSRPQE
jgi:hypothetical protein